MVVFCMEGCVLFVRIVTVRVVRRQLGCVLVVMLGTTCPRAGVWSAWLVRLVAVLFVLRLRTVRGVLMAT